MQQQRNMIIESGRMRPEKQAKIQNIQRAYPEMTTTTNNTETKRKRKRRKGIE